MSKIESGTIFKFSIPFGLGVGYCKLIDFTHIFKYDAITIKIYDFFEDIEIKDPAFFKDMPLFMNPIPIVKMPSIRGKYAWKKLGVLNEIKDAEIPIYKKYVSNGFGWATIEEYEERQWYALVNLKDNIGPVHFNKVRHLEELFWRSTVTIEERMAMLKLRYQGIDVNDFFCKNCTDKSWRVDYQTQQFIPLYKKIPEVIRGKPLIKGYVPDEYLNFDWDSIKDQ